MTDENSKKIKVLYNSACPVCNAGVNSQKGKMNDCNVEWNDVHTDNSKADAVDSELEYIREKLHVVDENGKTQIGFDAFLTIWRYSEKEKWKAILLGLPGIKQICSLLYNLFARFLYKWNKGKQHW